MTPTPRQKIREMGHKHATSLSGRYYPNQRKESYTEGAEAGFALAVEMLHEGRCRSEEEAEVYGMSDDASSLGYAKDWLEKQWNET